jgi:chromate transporter
LRLGLTSFGGPVAHLGYFQNEFVKRRAWLSDEEFAEFVALCQFLPGPSSSQVGIALGHRQHGFKGALAAWAGFTLPSAIILVMFGFGLNAAHSSMGGGWIHGLKIAAAAVVAQAIWLMGRKLCPDSPRIAIAAVSTLCILMTRTVAMQIVAIVLGGLIGALVLRRPIQDADPSPRQAVHLSKGISFLGLFGALLVALPFIAKFLASDAIAQFEVFYRAGSLVFGGGHVVLPLLQAEVVPRGWVSEDIFLAGYGAAQAVPGPLFTFAAFLGAVSRALPGGIAGAALCLGAIFLPSFLLVIGALPLWERLRLLRGAPGILAGVNAAVVGLLIAAFIDPIWSTTIKNWMDVAWLGVLFLLLTVSKLPPWLVVVLAALGVQLISLVLPLG